MTAADAAGEPVLLVGGGSNLVVGDAGWPGLVVRVASDTVTRTDHDGEQLLTVAAGVPWDDLVAATVADGLAGLETMSGTPGRTGATPVQNVGAYGSEVTDVLTGLRVHDRQAATVQCWSPRQCSGCGARRGWCSTPPTMTAGASDRSSSTRYWTRYRTPRWTAHVGRPTAGPSSRPPGSSSRPVFPRGWGLDRGRDTVSVSTKHTLALTNRGGATTAELLALAAEIRAGVEARFDIRLGPEAHLRNCAF